MKELICDSCINKKYRDITYSSILDCDIIFCKDFSWVSYFEDEYLLSTPIEWRCEYYKEKDKQE